MARRYVNPNRDSRRIRSAAELEALLREDPGPWTLIRTADLETMTDKSADLDLWASVADAMREGLR